MKAEIALKPHAEKLLVPAFKLDIQGLIITKAQGWNERVVTSITHEPTGLLVIDLYWDWYTQPVPVAVARKCALKAQEKVPIDWWGAEVAVRGRAWNAACEEALREEEAKLWEAAQNERDA